MTTARTEVQTEAATTTEELSLATLAVRVVCCTTIAHQTFALHQGAFAPSLEVVLPHAFCVLVKAVGAHLVDEDVVVVAELIVNANLAVGIVQVVLRFLTVATILVGSELVNVGVLCATKEVGHGLIVHTLCAVVLETEGITMMSVDIVIEERVERFDHLVVVATLLIVKCLVALGGSTAVDRIHAVPIYLAVGLRTCPIVVKLVPAFQSPRILLQPIITILFGIVHIEDR